MIKTVPSKEEMRLLVKNIYETGIKLNGKIPVNNLDDAARLAAYLYGFSSWKEYQISLHNESKHKIKEEFVLKLPKFKEKIIKRKSNFFLNIENMNLLDEESKLQKIEKPELSKIIPLEWLIGKKRNTLAKIDEPMGLLAENYIVASSPLSNVSNLLKNQLEWFLKYQQTFFLFGMNSRVESQEIIKLLEKNQIHKIGNKGLKIDPIEESFENEGFESLLNLSPFGEENTFSWIWGMMVRTLRDELNLKWTSKSLLESLNIESLLEIMEKIKTINPLVAKPLSQYLNKQCEVEYEGGNYILNENGQARHYHQIFLIKEKLEKLDKLYELGYFSNYATISIKECVFKKKSAYFLECNDDELKKIYWDACNISYINAIKKQVKVLQDIDEKPYRVWGIWWSAENILSEDRIDELNEYKDAAISGFFIFSHNQLIESAFKKIRQIVFLRQKINTYPQEWINRALIETEYWEENIWFEHFDKLKKLSEKDAYIWKPKTLLVPLGTESYELKKINLYLSDPEKN